MELEKKAQDLKENQNELEMAKLHQMKAKAQMQLAETKERVLKKEKEREQALETYLKKKQFYENMEAETAMLRQQRIEK